MGKPDLCGHQVGPYHLIGILGVGSAGTVYRAVDATSEHPTSFAVKCLPKTWTMSEGGAQLVAELFYQNTVAGCPHVLTLRDAIKQGRYLFLVLDLCESDVYKAIWKNPVYWRNDALIRKAFIEMLDGVNACHERKVFHRDLKPENIMCKADGTDIKIGDFGMATHRYISRDGRCGTPYYMSPGQ